ncbi:MAG: hypothetical protein JNJ58_11240 [Chitinophagaceae bacterium]|nr:hypothetical protein [Chitinophagaceae bacterium]
MENNARDKDGRRWSLGELMHNLFIQSQVFVGMIAVLLSMETRAILRMGSAPLPFYWLVFFLTIFAYNLYYFPSGKYRLSLPMTMVSALGALLCFLFLPDKPIGWLLLMGSLSIIYEIPSFLKVPRLQAYTLFKPLLLTAIWMLCTYFWPARQAPVDDTFMFYGLYRLLFLFITIFHFHVRDEVKQENARPYHTVLILLHLILIFLAAWISLSIHQNTGMIYLGMSVVYLLVSFYFMIRRRSEYAYTFGIDGMLFLQAIFVLLELNLTFT